MEENLTLIRNHGKMITQITPIHLRNQREEGSCITGIERREQIENKDTSSSGTARLLIPWLDENTMQHFAFTKVTRDETLQLHIIFINTRERK